MVECFSYTVPKCMKGAHVLVWLAEDSYGKCEMLDEYVCVRSEIASGES